MELIKAIKECMELLRHMKANRDFKSKELYIVTRYGNASLYLAPEKA